MGHGVAQGHWRWTKQAKAWHLGDQAQRGHAGICSVHKHGTCAVGKAWLSAAAFCGIGSLLWQRVGGFLLSFLSGDMEMEKNKRECLMEEE